MAVEIVIGGSNWGVSMRIVKTSLIWIAEDLISVNEVFKSSVTTRTS